jgi:hypothetical protein
MLVQLFSYSQAVCVFAAVQITQLYSTKSGWYDVRKVFARVADIEPNSVRKYVLKGMRAVIGRENTRLAYTWYKNMLAELF